MISAAIVGLAGCGPEAAEEIEDPRCPVFIDRLVTDDFWPTPWPAQSHGDEALELWFGDFGVGHDGFALQPDGSYAKTWHFEMEDFTGFDDYDLDGLDDPYASGWAMDDGRWSFRRMGMDGLPEPTIVDLGVDPSELVTDWGDLDEDGLIDRTARIGSELWLITGAGARARLDDGTSGEASAGRVGGDPRVLSVRVESGDMLTLRLVRVGDGASIEPVWGPTSGPWRGVSARLTDDLVELYITSPPGEIGEPRDLLRRRIDRRTGVVEERVLELGIRGLSRHDFDGDGFPDLAIFHFSSICEFRWGDADGEFGPAQKCPDTVNWGDSGIHQTFDLEQDGAMEILLAEPMDDGRRQWRSLQFERCE